jgi:glucosamine-6-phosphate deaminase
MASEKSVFGSSSPVDPRNLRRWCAIPAAELPGHPELRVPYRQVADSAELGALMAMELIETIEENNRRDRPTRAILPCGPTCWYEPFKSLVNTRGVSLKSLHVIHMDECLDWQGRPLPAGHPYNFRTGRCVEELVRIC